MWSVIFVLYRRYEEISSDFDSYDLINENLNEILLISGNIDNILEMPGLEEFCNYCIKDP